MDKEEDKGTLSVQDFIAAYLKLSKDTLKEKIKSAEEILKNCTLCPRNCKVDRTSGETHMSQRDTKDNENYPSPIPLPQGEGVRGRVKNEFLEQKGFCKTGDKPFVSSYNPHFGEERPLVGNRGSGTIFFTHCNLGCLFCQNWTISHLGEGSIISFGSSCLSVGKVMSLRQYNTVSNKEKRAIKRMKKSV